MQIRHQKSDRVCWSWDLSWLNPTENGLDFRSLVLLVFRSLFNGLNWEFFTCFRPKLNTEVHKTLVYIYTVLDLTCDSIRYKKLSQVKSFHNLLRIRSSQVIFLSKSFKSSQVKWLVTWLDLIQVQNWLDLPISDF